MIVQRVLIQGGGIGGLVAAACPEAVRRGTSAAARR